MDALETTSVLAQEPLDVGDLASKVGEPWRSAVSRTWVVQTSTPVIASVDRGRLEEALDALIENAVRFTGGTDTIRLSAGVHDTLAVVEVADSGPGIPEQDREALLPLIHGMAGAEGHAHATRSTRECDQARASAASVRARLV